MLLAVSVVLLAKSRCGRRNELKQGQEESVQTAWYVCTRGPVATHVCMYSVHIHNTVCTVYTHSIQYVHTHTYHTYIYTQHNLYTQTHEHTYTHALVLDSGCTLVQYSTCPPWCRRLTKGTLVLLPLLAFTWVLGLFAVRPGENVMVIVFVALNSITVSVEFHQFVLLGCCVGLCVYCGMSSMVNIVCAYA